MLYYSRFTSGTVMSCLGIYPSCFTVRMNCTKALKRIGNVTTYFSRSSSLVLGGSAIITGTLSASLYRNSQVLCRPKSWTRTVELDYSDGDKEHHFPWKEFLKLMLPDIWHLFGAILVCSFYTVIFCIQLCFANYAS